MIWVPEGENDQVCTVGDEHTLLTTTRGGLYRVQIDVGAAFVGGATPDILKVLCYALVRDATYRLIASPLCIVGGVMHSRHHEFGDFATDRGFRLAVNQTQGTSRTIGWKVLRMGTLVLVTVVSDAGNTATTFKTDLAINAKDAGLRFISGALASQIRRVESQTGDTVTMESAFTATPAPGDVALLVH
jgi:hypothetical protein